MNKTKRKIFETSMKLFAEKGYDATSIEEITATVGVAKGTLYYHFSSKEEIFNFLVEEGVKLLKNSISIKTDKLKNSILCKKYVFEYIQMIEEIVQEGIEKEEIIEANSNIIASGIFGFISSSFIYKMRYEGEIEVAELFAEVDNAFIKKLIRQR